jgi:hypothetical protein
VLPEVQAYDCAGIEWFAWITDRVWVRIILARIAETSEATSEAHSRSLTAELSAKTSPQTIASTKPNPLSQEGEP